MEDMHSQASQPGCHYPPLGPVDHGHWRGPVTGPPLGHGPDDSSDAAFGVGARSVSER